MSGIAHMINNMIQEASRFFAFVIIMFLGSSAGHGLTTR